MPSRSPGLVAVLLLVMAFAPALAGAQAPQAMEWEYRVSLPDPATGRVRVEATFRNLDGVVERMTLLTLDHRSPVHRVEGGPRTRLETVEGGVAFTVDDREERVVYEVDARRDAFKAGEYLSYVGDAFGLFKAETFALAYTYRYYEGKPFEWRGKVVLDPPPGWSAAGPWARGADGAYALPPGEVLPRGYVVFGPFEETETVAGSKTVRYARLGAAPPFEAELHGYVEKATPYYQAVYGPGTGSVLLVVTAPDPMFRGGLGASDSLFVHETADLRTFAHEYAHVHQLFGTDETPGQSAIWLNEGDADYRSALSLFASGHWTPDEVNRFLDEISADRHKPEYREALLAEATYGGDLERFAYHKGATLLRALDGILAARSDQELGASDLLRALNAAHDPAKPENRRANAGPVTNADIRAELGRMMGPDGLAWFDRYVLGPDWPDVTPFVPEGDVGVSDLTVTPPRAAPGEPIQARVLVHNRGTDTFSTTVTLLLDGEPVASRPLSLGVGASAPVAFDLVAPDPGDHELRVLYLRQPFRSLTPPAFAVDRVTLSPVTVHAGASAQAVVFLRNDGEQDAVADVEALVAGRLIGSTRGVVVGGNATQAVAVAATFAEAGEQTLRLRIVGEGQEILHDVVVAVRPADRDQDGVPDGDDAFPLNPRLAEAGLVNQARDTVPGPTPLALLVALLAGARALRALRRA